MIGGGGNRTNLTNNKKDLNHIKSHMMSWGRQKMLEDRDDHENLVLKEQKGVVISGRHQNNNNKKKVAEINKREVNIFQVWYESLCKIKKKVDKLYVHLFIFHLAPKRIHGHLSEYQIGVILYRTLNSGQQNLFSKKDVNHNCA